MYDKYCLIVGKISVNRPIDQFCLKTKEKKVRECIELGILVTNLIFDEILYFWVGGEWGWNGIFAVFFYE